MKRASIVLLVLGLALSAVYAEFKPLRPMDNVVKDKEIVWQMLTHQSSASSSGGVGPHYGYQDNQQFYYNHIHPTELDSLITTYSSNDLNYATQVYYDYTNTPDYRQMEEHHYFDGYPDHRIVKRYTNQGLLFYEAEYSSSDDMTRLIEYYYNEFGNLIKVVKFAEMSLWGPVSLTLNIYDDSQRMTSNVSYDVLNQNLDNLSLRSGHYWTYAESGLLIQEIEHKSSPNLLKTTYIYNEDGLESERTSYTSLDSLVWDMNGRKTSSYATSFGEIKPIQEISYKYSPMVDSLVVSQVWDYTYSDNNHTFDVTYECFFPDELVGTTGTIHNVYNDAGKLLVYHSESSSEFSSYSYSIVQTWNCVDTAADDPIQPPNTIRLTSYPNPFNPSTTISYELPAPGNTVLELYNIRGQRVRTLFSGQQEAGQHSLALEVDSGTMASGVYFLRLTSGSKTGSTKLLLMK